MQITVQISEEIRLAAEARKIPVVDLVEELISKGLNSQRAQPTVTSAIERIRALRSSPLPPSLKK
jgi:hypothetical protein